MKYQPSADRYSKMQYNTAEIAACFYLVSL